MCNLKEKTDLKTVTVYKVVRRNKNGDYCSVFAGTPFFIGKVVPQHHYEPRQLNMMYHWYNELHNLYNAHMVGKCSGFEKRSVAETLAKAFNEGGFQVLKVELGGEIWTGDCKNISVYVDYDEVMFAGTHVLSYELVYDCTTLQERYNTSTPTTVGTSPLMNVTTTYSERCVI